MHAGKIRDVSATTTFLCVYSVAVAAVEKGYAFHFLFEVLLLPIILRVGCSDPAAGACAAYNISIEAERGTGYSSFLLRYCPLHCDALDVYYCCCCSGCFHFCHLDCDASVMVIDCAAVETGCMLEKYKMVAHLQC